jgi:hypothetical protein
MSLAKYNLLKNHALLFGTWCAFVDVSQCWLQETTNMSPRILAFATIALLAGQPAFADVISYTTIADQSNFMYDPISMADKITVALPDFDPALGTLTGATLVFSGTNSPQFNVINVGDVAGTGIGSTLATYTLTGAGVSIFTSAPTGPQTVAVGGAVGDHASSAQVPSPFDVLVDLNPALVKGSGSNSFVVDEEFATSGTTNTVGADLAYGGGGDLSFDLTVAYSYTPEPIPAPEPVSMALLGTGLIGLGIIKRRRA